jgi:hypothetical protein
VNGDATFQGTVVQPVAQIPGCLPRSLAKPEKPRKSNLNASHRSVYRSRSTSPYRISKTSIGSKALPMSGRGAAHRDKIRFYCDRHHIHGAVARYTCEHPIWLPFSSKWTRTMSHEHDLVSIDVVIQQAKEQRAKDIAEACAPALKTLRGFALAAVLVPWQLVRQALSHMTS